jgi:3',5'-cyclic AMP phosphodiesterase CpdA
MKKLESFLLVIILLCASCAKDQMIDPPGKVPGNNSRNNLICPQIKIAVVSDIHYLDPTLMPDNVSNQDFQAIMAGDRKIIELSDPIFRKVVDEIIAEKPDIMMVPGDLSFNGELYSHNTVSEFLKQIEDHGIRVYVIPGNNDIRNSDAMNYSKVPAEPAENISNEKFAEIYEDFGYGENEAIYRDENSLSYISQPFSHLWILGLDVCKYSVVNGKTKVSGVLNPLTLSWIKERMNEANEKNITVLAMMHYGVVEHYSGQNTIEALVNRAEYPKIANDLLDAGIKLIFTGHYHASDIVELENNGKTLFDIQTGSLVTPPYSYRILTLDDNFINIRTRRVTDVVSEITGDMDFLTYSDVNLNSRLISFFIKYGAGVRAIFGISEEEYQVVLPFLVNAYKAYLGGDEKIGPEERKSVDSLGQSIPAALPLLNVFWTDLPPLDNKIQVELK